MMFKPFAKFIVVLGSLALFAGGTHLSQELYRVADHKRALSAIIPRTPAEAREMIRQLQAENEAHPAPQRASAIAPW